jgi:chromate transporter
MICPGQVAHELSGFCPCAPWRGAIQAGLLPTSVGLIAASAFVVASVAVHNLTAVLVIAVTAVVTNMTRLNPLWIFAAAALLGLTG